MNVTIQEAMSIGGLKKCKLVAGHKGMDREISHVTVMEVPDAVEWLKGNDLLLTSLYPIKDDPEALNKLVYQLIEKGSAGLAIKTHRFVKEIPEAIIQAANKTDFPIIEIDKEVPYLDIITPLMSAILGGSSLKHENIDDINEVIKWITELALSGEGLEIIVKTLTKILKNTVTIESETSLIKTVPNYDILPLNREEKNKLRKSNRPLFMTRLLNQQKTACLVAPIILNREVNGFITIWQNYGKLRNIDITILERVVPLIALEFLKVKTENEVEQKYKGQFLSEILTGKIKNKEEILNKSIKYGWDLSQDFQLCVLDVDNFNAIVNKLRKEVLIQEFKQRTVNSIERFVRKRESTAIVAGWSDLIAILYPVKGFNTSNSLIDEVRMFASILQRRLKKIIPEVTFTVGIGRFYPELEGLHFGYKECLQSINLGREIWGRGKIIHFNDLGIYRILCQHSDRQELVNMYKETVDKLVEYDKKHNGFLTKTLEQYFKQNMNLKETAQALFIHVNTLKYRLKKIEELTGYSVNDSEGHLHLHLGLKVSQVINADHGMS